MQDSHAEVLVIGAGPTGLFVAAELARHGVRARIIEQALTPHTQTRATEIQPAVMEVFHRAGLAEKFLEFSLPMKGLRIFDTNMEEAYVFSIPAADSLYSTTRSMPQWRTEEILTENLTALGIEVERGVTAQDITMTENGARVECVDRDGNPFAIQADYLIGAGGTHSKTRNAMEKHLEGITYPRTYLVADVAAPGVHCDGHCISVAIAKTGLVMTIELPDGRSLILTDLPNGEPTNEPPELEDVKAAIAVHVKKPFEVSDLRWASVYRMHRRMSPTFSMGRCFLAGDAAHICSPLGGEGLNSGILDAASIAWKLAAVLRRGGKPALLEAYEPERREIARQVLESCDFMHEYYDALVALAAEGKPLAEPGADPTRKVVAGSMLGLTLSESPILGFHGFYRTNAPIKPGHRFPERIRLAGFKHHLLVYRAATEWDSSRFASRWANVLEILDGPTICPPEKSGVADGGAVLVRPDGYIAFQAEKWNDAAQETLDEFLLSQFSPREEAAAADCDTLGNFSRRLL